VRSQDKPRVSFVLATYNRRAQVEHTLAQLERCGLERGEFETIVVDNGSDDGTRASIRTRVDLLVELRRNAGSCAKAYGVDHARGEFVVFLDDDSHPRPGAVARMIEHFQRDSALGGAGFTVHLPNGERECGALPGVFVGCGAGFRAEALRACGGLDRTFFMQAEEYDLGFRLAGCGWKVAVFDDLHVEHLKTPQARRSERTSYFDMRNNLRVIGRYLPGEAARVYRADWERRYAWLAARDGHLDAFERGRRAGGRYAIWERWTYRSRRLSETSFERFFGWEAIRRRMVALAESGVRRVLFADLGKNVFPFHRAADLAAVEVVAIADDRFAGPGRAYRGVPIVPVSEAMNLGFDAVVVSNCAAVFAARTVERFRGMGDWPVYAWFASAGEESVESGSVQRAAAMGADEGMGGVDIGRTAAVVR